MEKAQTAIQLTKAATLASGGGTVFLGMTLEETVQLFQIMGIVVGSLTSVGVLAANVYFQRRRLALEAEQVREADEYRGG